MTRTVHTLLRHFDYEFAAVVGVYSTRELAIEAARSHARTTESPSDSYRVEGWVVGVGRSDDEVWVESAEDLR